MSSRICDIEHTINILGSCRRLNFQEYGMIGLLSNRLCDIEHITFWKLAVDLVVSILRNCMLRRQLRFDPIG